MADWADVPLPGLEPDRVALGPDLLAFLSICERCGGSTLATQPVVSAEPNVRGNLRLIVADGDLYTEAVPISQHQPGEHLHLAHVVTCRPRKEKTNR